MKRWTPKEDEVLRARYPLEGSRALSLALGRPRLSVRMRASQLSIRWLPSKKRAQKICTRCGMEKPASEFRIRKRESIEYLNATCRTCDAAIQRSVPADVRSAVARRWRAAHPERVKELTRKYDARRKEKKRALFAAWYGKNKERVRVESRERMNAIRLADPEAFNARVRARYAKDSSAVKVAYHRRRARLKNVPATLTREEWKDIVTRYESRCAYCNKEFQRLTQDHVIPISRGGAHSADNVVPACRPCNASKNNKLLEEWRA